MSNPIAPGSSADVNVQVRALGTDPNVSVQYKTVILKKNLVNGVNTLTQAMMNQTNTKYVIKYDYVLGSDITVLANCVLEFDGGSISANGSNDTITGANTGIQAGLIKIFNTDITLAGSWNVVEAYPEWFGFNITDCSPFIQKCIDSFSKVSLVKRYNTANTINLTSNQIIEGKRPICGIKYSGTDNAINIHESTPGRYGSNAIQIKNIQILSNLDYYSYYEASKSFTNNAGINFEGVAGKNHVFKNLAIEGFKYGICSENALWGCLIENCSIHYCNDGLRINGSINFNIKVTGGYLGHCKNCLIVLISCWINFDTVNFGNEWNGTFSYCSLTDNNQVNSRITFKHCNFEGFNEGDGTIPYKDNYVFVFEHGTIRLEDCEIQRIQHYNTKTGGGGWKPLIQLSDANIYFNRLVVADVNGYSGDTGLYINSDSNVYVETEDFGGINLHPSSPNKFKRLTWTEDA